jgi:sterol 14-demethylase
MLTLFFLWTLFACVAMILCILQGDVVAISPNFNHVLPQIFERPLSYEPERFSPPRDEDKKKPFSYMGFGGGRHACIGQNFAYLQVSSSM